MRFYLYTESMRTGKCSATLEFTVESLFYFLSIVQIAMGLYLVWQGLQWLGYARRRAATDPGFYAPRTAVLCSCKGLEPGLERNLTTLTEFDHQNYEIIFRPGFGIGSGIRDREACRGERTYKSSRGDRRGQTRRLRRESEQPAVRDRAAAAGF